MLITSARAEGTSIGNPAAHPAYRETSGTSMASPHVAGAAAILLQAQPDLGDGRFEFFLDVRDPVETSGFVSLRVEAWDADGNRIEQEIMRPWRLPER